MDKIKAYQEFDVYFHDVDYADIKIIEAEVSLRSFIAGMLSYSPWWIVVLYRLREILVNIFGLVRHQKPYVLRSIKPEDLPFEPGKKAVVFIVRDAKEDVYWVSETPEDKHLKAFFGVVAEQLGNGRTRYHVFTSVKYIHWTGPVYFNLIRPFHHIIVSGMMKAGIKGWNIT